MREKELKIELFKQNFLKSLTENDWELYHTYLNLDEIKEVLRKDLNCRFEEIGLVFDSEKEFSSEYYLTANGKINIVWKLKVIFENTDGLSDKNVIKNIEVYELSDVKYNEFERNYSEFINENNLF